MVTLDNKISDSVVTPIKTGDLKSVDENMVESPGLHGSKPTSRSNSKSNPDELSEKSKVDSTNKEQSKNMEKKPLDKESFEPVDEKISNGLPVSNEYLSFANDAVIAYRKAHGISEPIIDDKNSEKEIVTARETPSDESSSFKYTVPSHNGEGTTYTFINVRPTTDSKGDIDDEISYRLTLRQQPKHSRMCGFGEKVDRRPLDPPPIVQLEIDLPDKSEKTAIEKTKLLYNPNYFMYVSVISNETEEELHVLSDGKTRYTIGTVVSSMYKLRDLDDKEGAFFIFSDLSIRREGVYKLKFALFEIVGGILKYRASICSNPFNVYPAKKFPGMEESTALSKAFAEQGLKIRIRREVRAKKRHLAYSSTNFDEYSNSTPVSNNNTPRSGTPVQSGNNSASGSTKSKRQKNTRNEPGLVPSISDSKIAYKELKLESPFGKTDTVKQDVEPKYGQPEAEYGSYSRGYNYYYQYPPNNYPRDERDHYYNYRPNYNHPHPSHPSSLHSHPPPPPPPPHPHPHPSHVHPQHPSNSPYNHPGPHPYEDYPANYNYDYNYDGHFRYPGPPSQYARYPSHASNRARYPEEKSEVLPSSSSSSSSPPPKIIRSNSNGQQITQPPSQEDASSRPDDINYHRQYSSGNTNHSHAGDQYREYYNHPAYERQYRGKPYSLENYERKPGSVEHYPSHPPQFGAERLYDRRYESPYSYDEPPRNGSKQGPEIPGPYPPHDYGRYYPQNYPDRYEQYPPYSYRYPPTKGDYGINETSDVRADSKRNSIDRESSAHSTKGSIDKQ